MPIILIIRTFKVVKFFDFEYLKIDGSLVLHSVVVSFLHVVLVGHDTLVDLDPVHVLEVRLEYLVLLVIGNLNMGVLHLKQ